jgi:hypothetical protein
MRDGYNYFETDEYKRRKAEMGPSERAAWERMEASAEEYERQLNAPTITRDYVHTAEPLPVPERSDRSRRMKGVEPPKSVTVGLHSFRGKHHRERAALYHNAALQARFRSELEGTRAFTHVHVSDGP